MKSGNLVTKFNFLFLLVFFLLTLSVNSEEVQISPLLKLDEISPSYEEVFDEDLNIIIDESQTKQRSLEDDDVDFVIISILNKICLLYTSPSPRDATLSRMPSSA